MDKVYIKVNNTTYWIWKSEWELEKSFMKEQERKFREALIKFAWTEQ